LQTVLAHAVLHILAQAAPESAEHHIIVPVRGLKDRANVDRHTTVLAVAENVDHRTIALEEAENVDPHTTALGAAENADHRTVVLVHKHVSYDSK
jgi:hypothetical protein